MGSWGVKATESDYGLDLLGIVEKRYLQERNYKLFNVNEIMELLKNHIVDEIKKINRGCSKKDMEFYIQETFPYRYDHAVILIAECLTDYFRDGKLTIELYEAERDKILYNTLLLTERLYPHIAEIGQTADKRLEQLMTEMLMKNPAPDKADNQMKWAAHMNGLKATAEELIMSELIHS